MKNIFLFFFVALVSGSALASLPAEVTSSLSAMKIETLAVAAAFVVIAISVAAFMRMRTVANPPPDDLDEDKKFPCQSCGEEFLEDELKYQQVSNSSFDGPFCASCMSSLDSDSDVSADRGSHEWVNAVCMECRLEFDGEGFNEQSVCPACGSTYCEILD